ncbi:MAG: signal peptidase II [Bdellovibrionales bacterium RIFCSPHIGHO2_01_FULL_40_29]|nr:MAG: signal peptidase II [Bdellovibrionales bacterium RIFCSPHIGHO2_01_FULL_40_29]OFZ34209.1 MAG: signal peptidase II [Bdellovibrionales bacterium RIFCSPHIGHO2_02_FULL_40_15]
MTLKFKFIVVGILLFLLVGLDQATKYWAVNTLQGQDPSVFLGGFFSFTYAENTGAFLGFGGSWSRTVRFLVFAVVVVIGLGGMLWYLLKNETSRLNLLAYTFIMGGGFGNLWDRMTRENGGVIDFMVFDTGARLNLGFIEIPLRTGVVNVADIAIVAGVLLAILSEYYFDKRRLNRAK